MDAPRPEDIDKVARELRAESLFAHDAWASRSGTSDAPSQVGPYALVAPIGKGGMGVVFRAKAPDGGDVAVKVLRRHDSNEDLLRFDREMKLLSLFGARDGFVPLLDRGESDDGPFLVMPLLEGGTLRDRLRKGPLRIADALALVRGVAQAVGRAHERGIVHRDLKPENILFQADGEPLVADLGLAKYFSPQGDRRESLSRTGDLCGTLSYMAPEQACDSKSSGPRADVFSLGAILFECLAGRRAFGGAGVLSVIQRRELEPLRRIRPETPPWVVAVVERALAPGAAERFADGHAFARALVPPTRTARRFLALLLVVAAGGAVLAAVLSSSRAREARRHVERAEAALHAHDRNGAIAEATRAIDLDPELALAWANRAMARCIKADADGALADAKRALELAPGLALAWAAQSGAHASQGDNDRAFAEASKAIELDPGLALAWATRGFARYGKADREGAIVDLTKAIELDGELGLAWGTRAAARGDLNDFDGAIADASRAIALDPRLFLSWATLATAHCNRGNWDECIACSNRAIELRPHAFGVFTMRARARGRKGDLAGQLADLDKAIEIAPGFAKAWVERASARLAADDVDGSIADLTRAIEIDPGLVAAWCNRGLTREKKDDWEGEISDLTKALALDPKCVRALEHRGIARKRKDDPEGAVSDLERFLELAPDDPEAPVVRQELEGLRKRSP